MQLVFCLYEAEKIATANECMTIRNWKYPYEELTLLHNSDITNLKFSFKLHLGYDLSSILSLENCVSK